MPVALSHVLVMLEKLIRTLNWGFVYRKLFPVELFPLPVGPRRIALRGFRSVGENKHKLNG